MRSKQIFDAMLPVVLVGTGCTMCPALKYRISDEQRYCQETGEVIERWKKERGADCPLRNVTERQGL